MSQTLPLRHQVELDYLQKQVVESPIEISVVEAIAGAGKTRCLIHRITNLINHGVDPENILMITFTVNAAQEMASRLEAETPRASTVTSGTFHSVALSLLQEDAQNTGAPVQTIVDPEDDDMIWDIVINRFLNETYHQPVTRVAMAEYYQKRLLAQIDTIMINEMVDFSKALEKAIVRTHFKLVLDPVNNPEIYQNIQNVILAYRAFKKESNVVNYDDILKLFYEKLQNDTYRQIIQNKFHHLLVDEYQDINYLQFLIIQKLTNQSLMGIGDTHQNIYAWRGSDSRFIKHFEMYFPNAKRYQINQNYRCAKNILEATQLIFDNNQDIVGSTQLIPTQGAGTISIDWYQNDFEENKAIVQKIMQIKNQNPHESVAILARYWSVLRSIQMELAAARIDHIILGEGDFYQSDVVKDFKRIIQFIINPKNSINTRQVLKLFGLSVGVVDKIIDQVCDKPKNIDAIQSLLTEEEFAENQAVLNMMRNIIVLAHRPKLRNSYFVHYCYNNFYQNILAERIEARQDQGMPNPYKDRDDYNYLVQTINESPSLLHWLDKANLSTHLEVFNTNPDAVKLSTIHGSKGLEYQHVFVPAWTSIPGSYKQEDRSDNISHKEETLNLTYVAFTRSIKSCNISGSRYQQYYGSMKVREFGPFLEDIMPKVDLKYYEKPNNDDFDAYQ